MQTLIVIRSGCGGTARNSRRHKGPLTSNELGQQQSGETVKLSSYDLAVGAMPVSAAGVARGWQGCRGCV